MNDVLNTPLMTTEEMLALPENGVDRELIRGKLREKPMTRRGRRHTRSAGNLVFFLQQWLRPDRSHVVKSWSVKAGFRIRRDPDTTVGIDVAYIGPQTTLTVPEDVFLIDALPILAVEVLSPSDTQEDITDKVADYLDAGIPLVWVLEPVFRTVCVYQPDKEPEMFTSSQELTGDPHLPGFRVLVKDLF
jgi:Uma2 family endonuclease